MMGTMASSMAGSVAGSVIGHGIGNAMFGGGGGGHAPAPVADGAAPQAMPTMSPCTFETQQFLQCMSQTSDNMDYCRSMYDNFKIARCRRRSRACRHATTVRAVRWSPYEPEERPAGCKRLAMARRGALGAESGVG